MRVSTLLPLVLATLGSCQIVPFGLGDTPDKPRVDWGPEDGEELAREALAPFFTSPELSRLAPADAGFDARILAVTCGLLNGTREPLDPDRVSAGLRRAMLETGRFRFPPADRSEQALAQEIRARPGAAHADEAQVAEVGARVGAELALYATLSKSEKNLYRFTVEAVEVGTAQRLWSGAVELDEDQLRRLVDAG